MRVIKNLADVCRLSSFYFTIGSFDGFHAGHRLILHRLLSLGKGERTLVVTFDTLPSNKSGMVRKHIYPLETKLKMLIKMGIDYCLLLDFSEVRKMDYRIFLDYFLSEKDGKEGRGLGLIASDKLRLGYQREGKPDAVKKYFEERGKKAIFLSSLSYTEKSDKSVREVSSSRIRELLTGGNLYWANRKLGLPFHFNGKVKKGKSWGRKIGFPTLNFSYPEESVDLPYGSYITITVIRQSEPKKKSKSSFRGEIYPSMTYVGVPMAMNNEKKMPLVETYLLNFSKTVYNKWVTIYFLKNLEENKKLTDLEALRIFLTRLRVRLLDYLNKNPFFLQEKLKLIQNN